MSEPVDRLPVLLTVEDWVEWFYERGGWPLDRDTVLTAMGRVDRNAAPALLADLHVEFGPFDPDVAALAGDAWSAAEFPERQLDRETWRELFELAGYTVDGHPAERPASPLTLWRGATYAGRLGWSWTDNRTVAERFAYKQIRARETGRLWRAEVEPWRLFAHDDGREESEYVVDTDGLAVVEVAPNRSDAAAAARRQRWHDDQDG